jgi:hypothetical protein
VKSLIITGGLILGVSSLSSCRDRDESLVKSYLKRPALGILNGEEWEVKHVYINPTISTKHEDDYVFVFLPFKPKNPCPRESEISPETATAMVPAPTSKKKKYKLKRGTGRTMVFQYVADGDQKSLSAKKGKITLTKISDTTVHGKVVARYDSENWLNGTFEATVCEWNDFKNAAKIGG